MAQGPWEIRRYINEKGLRPFEEWLSTLVKKAQRRVDACLKRIVVGNFGDYASVGEGVYEECNPHSPPIVILGSEGQMGIVAGSIEELVARLTSGKSRRESLSVTSRL